MSDTSSSRVALSNVELQGRCTYRDRSSQKKGVGLEGMKLVKRLFLLSFTLNTENAFIVKARIAIHCILNFN